MDKRKVNGGGSNADDLDERAAKRRKAGVSLHSITRSANKNRVVLFDRWSAGSSKRRADVHDTAPSLEPFAFHRRQQG